MMARASGRPRRLPSNEGLQPPPPEFYAEFIGELADSANRVDAGADIVAEAAYCLRVVMTFIKRDNIAADAVLPGSPLTALHAALHDLQQGARPKLLAPRGAGGKPTNLIYRDIARAYIAAALDTLMRGKEAQEEVAAQWVAAKCRSLRIRYEGTPILAKHVRRWRSDLASEQTAAVDAIALFKRLRERSEKLMSKGLGASEVAEILLRELFYSFSEPVIRDTPPLSGSGAAASS